MTRQQLVLLYRQLSKEKFTESEILNWLLYFDTLGKPVAQRADCKWMCDCVILLPEDEYKVLQAVKVAKINHVDPLSYANPMAIINSFARVRETLRPIKPSKVSTLHYRYSNEKGIDVYDVDESEESRENMRRVIDTHFGVACNPWCLLAADQKGALTDFSARYWKYYSGFSKQVAFQNGRLCAFSAGRGHRRIWWDRCDQPHGGVRWETLPVPNDPLGRLARYETDLYTGHSEMIGGIYRGSKENGLCERYRSLNDTEPFSRDFYCNGNKVVKLQWPGLTSAKKKALFASSDLANGIVRIPDSFKTIPSYAFRDAKRIKEVYIPDTVQSLGQGIFVGCTGLRKVRLPSHLTSIPNEMFWGCKSLQEVDIPSSVESVGCYAFSGCTSLREIKLPDKMRIICDGTFQECSSLEALVIPKSVAIIARNAFRSCTSLEELLLPEHLNIVQDCAFQSCKSLKSITIPSSLSEVGSCAFGGCSFTEVIIPNTIKSISVCAFTMCFNIRKFTVCKRWYGLFRERYGRRVQLIQDKENNNYLNS